MINDVLDLECIKSGPALLCPLAGEAGVTPRCVQRRGLEIHYITRVSPKSIMSRFYGDLAFCSFSALQQ